MFRDTDIVGLEENEAIEDFSDDDFDEIGMLEADRIDLEKFEFNTVDVLQEMERTREKVLHYGEQYDVLPHVRCHQCGKVIGDLWEPYLEYSREKYYTPQSVIELLPLSEDERSTLMNAMGTPEFQILLSEYEVKSDYDILRQQRKYNNEQIFNKLGGLLLVPEEEKGKLEDALSDPARFQQLLKDYSLQEEYDEIVRLKTVNDLYNKPLLDEASLNALEAKIGKTREFKKLLKGYGLENEIKITRSVENSLALRILLNKLDFQTQYVNNEIDQEEYDAELRDLQNEILQRPGKIEAILRKYSAKREFDLAIQKYIVSEIKKVKVLTQIQQRNLTSLKNKPVQFQEALERYGRTKFFEDTIESKDYKANGEILDRLGGKLLRPCCRMNLLSPIHVPIKQEAFKEDSKMVQITNVLMNSQTTPVHVVIDESPEEGLMKPDPITYGDATPIIPGPGSSEIDQFQDDIIGSCRNIKRTPVSISDLNIDDELSDEEIEEIGEAASGLEEQVNVGAGRTVARKSRRYRAR